LTDNWGGGERNPLRKLAWEPPESAGKNQVVLQAGVFGAAGARKARPCVGVIRRRVHVRLGALDRAPTSCIFLGGAQLHTTSVLVRLRTMAIASAAGRNRTQHTGCVRKERQGTGYGQAPQERKPVQKMPQRRRASRRPPHEGIVVKVKKKTDGTRVMEPRTERLPSAGAFPIQFERRSKLELECEFGAL